MIDKLGSSEAVYNIDLVADAGGHHPMHDQLARTECQETIGSHDGHIRSPSCAISPTRFDAVAGQTNASYFGSEVRRFSAPEARSCRRHFVRRVVLIVGHGRGHD